MRILFHKWNNTAEEYGDITLTDDSEAMSTPHQRSEEGNGEKCINRY